MLIININGILRNIDAKSFEKYKAKGYKEVTAVKKKANTATPKDDAVKE